MFLLPLVIALVTLGTVIADIYYDFDNKCCDGPPLSIDERGEAPHMCCDGSPPPPPTYMDRSGGVSGHPQEW